MFDTLLVTTLFLLASLLVCLHSLRLSITIKHLCFFFHSLLILLDFFWPPCLFWPLCLLKVTKISSPPPRLFWLPLPPFTRHLRVHQGSFISESKSKTSLIKSEKSLITLLKMGVQRRTITFNVSEATKISKLKYSPEVY